MGVLEQKAAYITKILKIGVMDEVYIWCKNLQCYAFYIEKQNKKPDFTMALGARRSWSWCHPAVSLVSWI